MAYARALPCWSGAQPSIEQLGGGITNINLKVTDGEQAYVVRFGEDIPEHGVKRFNELAISQAAASVGIAPAVHYAEPGILVLDFVEAPALEATDLHDADTLQKVTRLIHRTHQEVTPAVRGPVLTFWVFHVLRDYAAFLRQNGSSHIGALDALMKDADALEQAVGPVQLVLGHNDLLPANILRGSEQFWLIDWEYGGFNSPLFDLGGLATNCELPSEAEHLMLQTYFGTPPDAALMQSYGAMKCASLLRETMWSMVSEITSEIDFDYAAYTADNLARYQQALSDYQSQRGTS
ncbi:phosphotransferase [Aliiroseovarius sp. KMU-50]|uniref:Phosphotransferase n=1 Tax=Aliiroseovarius salicola TaxID=3009082 RepID=A0ABT4W123_9RHOB|nr:phosphotransferase [Aliiroseovarius sp. KMU-50]MDA5094129.1 phosphotransferase [Aliiroseovarius sp. KMU-50]